MALESIKISLLTKRFACMVPCCSIGTVLARVTKAVIFSETFPNGTDIESLRPAVPTHLDRLISWSQPSLPVIFPYLARYSHQLRLISTAWDNAAPRERLHSAGQMNDVNVHITGGSIQQ